MYIAAPEVCAGYVRRGVDEERRIGQKEGKDLEDRSNLPEKLPLASVGLRDGSIGRRGL